MTALEHDTPGNNQPRHSEQLLQLEMMIGRASQGQPRWYTKRTYTVIAYEFQKESRLPRPSSVHRVTLHADATFATLYETIKQTLLTTANALSKSSLALFFVPTTQVGRLSLLWSHLCIWSWLFFDIERKKQSISLSDMLPSYLWPWCVSAHSRVCHYTDTSLETQHESVQDPSIYAHQGSPTMTAIRSSEKLRNQPDATLSKSLRLYSYC